MRTGVHAINWGIQRLAIVLVCLALAAVFAYVTLVFVIVAGQAIAGLSH